MLIEEDRENIELIRTTAQKVWDEDCVFGEFKEPNSPYPEFEWHMVLYGRFEVLLTYDKSIIGLNIWIEERFVNLRKLTSEELVRGFDSSKPENLLHNFQVLDRLLKTYMD